MSSDETLDESVLIARMKRSIFSRNIFMMECKIVSDDIFDMFVVL